MKQIVHEYLNCMDLIPAVKHQLTYNERVAMIAAMERNILILKEGDD